MDISGLHSESLAIELDSDILQTPVASSNESTENKLPSLFLFNDPPPSASDLVPTLPESICINRLSKNGLEELALCLNPPSRGSMLNWEYVAAKFGFPNSRIMHLRTCANPTAIVLKKIALRPLKDLLNVLAKLNRVDALLSIQPFLRNISNQNNIETLSTDSGAFLNAEKTDSRNYSESFSGSYLCPSTSGNNVSRMQSFILVTHHELGINVAHQKNYKWFLKNLRKQAKQANVSVLDIDDCLEANCKFEGLHTIFSDASSIVCIFTNDYMEMLNSNGNEQSVAIKQYLYKLMNAEFVERGDNQRFLAVTFQGTEREILPLGWAKSTLVYEFPAHHLHLFRKLFS